MDIIYTLNSPPIPGIRAKEDFHSQWSSCCHSEIVSCKLADHNFLTVCIYIYIYTVTSTYIDNLYIDISIYHNIFEFPNFSFNIFPYWFLWYGYWFLIINYQRLWILFCFSLRFNMKLFIKKKKKTNERIIFSCSSITKSKGKRVKGRNSYKNPTFFTTP